MDTYPNRVPTCAAGSGWGLDRGNKGKKKASLEHAGSKRAVGAREGRHPLTASGRLGTAAQAMPCPVAHSP